MNREIKFRAKSVDSNTKALWVYGDLLQLNDGSVQIGVHGQYIDDGYHFNSSWDKCVNVDEETIGQYTGLKDKNGKEIYEGDIVLTPFIDPIFGDLVGEELCVEREVVFHDGSFVVKVDNGYVYLECFTRGNNAEVIEKQ